MLSITYENEALISGTVSAFIQERKYLKNTTPKTLTWYGDAFQALEGALESETGLKQRIIELRCRGISPVSVNSWLRCIDAFLNWRGDGVKIPRLPRLPTTRSLSTPPGHSTWMGFGEATSMCASR